ncbi:MAG: carboxypeptidase regulatory-like domain-containing protein [Pyrinomonadaceae bacterium]
MRPMQIIAVVLLLAVAAAGQTNKGGISGTVLDQNGAAIPGATVTVTNVGTGQKQTLTTSDDGAFSATSLDPVVYSVTVEAQGFKTATIQSLKVDTSTTASANVIMEAGAVGDQVTVVADAPILNTESGATSSTITERQIQDVPLANRSVLDLALTAPNVTGDAGSEDPGVSADQPVPGFNLSAGGGRPGSTAMLADGVNNTGVGLARSVVSFTPETVQEFTVTTSAYSAEFGQTGGGVINVTTKSGTNDFNGVALWYHRNPVTNARPWRQGSAPRPANNLRYNQVSLTAGGPIMLPRFGEGGKRLYDGRNKSFFFVAYEPRWRTDFLTASGLLPTAAERAGNFSGLVRTASGFLPAAVAAQFTSQTINAASIGPADIFQQFDLVNGRLVPRAQTCTAGGVTTATFCQYANNTIPTSMIDPVSQKLLAFLPQPEGYFLDNGFVRNYTLTRSVTQDETRYTIRLDHNFTDSFKTNFRYTKTPAIGIRGAGNDINGNTGVYSDAGQYLLTFNNIITPSIVNDLRLNYTRANFSEDFSPEFAIKTGRSFAGEIGLNHLTPGGIPLFFLTQDTGYVNADIGAGGSTNNFNIEQRYNISDIAYWNRGNMSWKFGVNLERAQLAVTPFFAAAGGRWQFRTVNTSNNRGTGNANGGNDLASFLLGVPNTVDIRPFLLDYNYIWDAGAVFAQNDWKVRPNLTLNLGVRYSLQYPRREKNNLQGVFRPDLSIKQPFTAAQRRTIATALGVPATSPIPDCGGSVVLCVPTEATLPAFAFSGRGGRSRYITPVDYSGIEPRLGFAWQPKMKLFGMNFEDMGVVIRGGFGISHAALTGNNRSPNPDFGGFTQSSTVLAGSNGTADTGQPVRLSTNQPLQGNSASLDTILGTNAEGLVYFKSIGVPGIAVLSPNAGKVPLTQNWNLTLAFQPFRNTSVEIAYTGNRGRNLYLPFVNLNPRDIDVVEALEASNIGAETTITDPLGRTNLQGGAITIQRNSILAPFFGFNELNNFYDPSASSIRHAGYIDVRRRVGRGLTFTANYTYAKSIDNASDASPDVRVLTTGSTRGQVSYGAPLSGDRALSTYDVKNNFSATTVWDLPLGRRRAFFANAPKVVDQIIGRWTISGVFRMPGGTPFLPFLTDTNRLGGTNRTVRLDIVEGVPLKNPRWSPDCMVGATCEPFINPAAFMRPVKGQLGNAPRTLDIRPPRQEYFDFALSKDFPWPFAGNEKRRINFRVDLLNAFNHPNFRFLNTGNTPPGFGTFPTEITTEAVGGVLQPITAAEYNIWATANNQPLSTTTTGAQQLQAIRNTVNAVRLPSGALPLDFFHIRVPEGFATTPATSFDIRTLEGFRLFRLRQTYDTNFGTLREMQNPRYVQFGIRVFF